MVSVEVLRSLTCFGGVSSETLNALAAIAEDVEFQSGQVLWHSGDKASKMYLVRQGQIDVIYPLRDDKQCILDTVVGGEMTGWSAVIEPFMFTATGVARESGRALVLPAAGLRDLCQRDAAFGYRLFMQVAKTLASRLEGARLQLMTAS
jgi:CRP/FNR family cyclic AMP-dependent transcriptional regulator